MHVVKAQQYLTKQLPNHALREPLPSVLLYILMQVAVSCILSNNVELALQASRSS